MSNYDEAYKVLRSMSEKPYTIPKAFVRFMGNIEGGLFLNQVIFWSDKGNDKDWFYKTYEEWEEETTLSEYKVRKYSTLLSDKGFLDTKLKKANGSPTVHYRFLFKEFYETFIKFLGNVPKETSETLTDKYTDSNNNTKSDSEKSRESSHQSPDPSVSSQLDKDFDPEEWINNRDPIPGKVTMEQQLSSSHQSRTREEHAEHVKEALQTFGDRQSAYMPNVIKADLSFVPDSLHNLAQAFVERFGRGPIDDEKGYWLKSFNKMQAMGVTAEDIHSTYDYMLEEELAITSPKSIANLAYSMKNAKEEKSSKSNSTGFSQAAMEFMNRNK